MMKLPEIFVPFVNLCYRFKRKNKFPWSGEIVTALFATEPE